jgi:hypothetical protein
MIMTDRDNPVRRADLPQSRYSYDYRHDLVMNARGKARDQKCVRCAENGTDRQAKEWAQVHTETGDDPWADYVPLCKPCHVAYDGNYPPIRVGGNPDLGRTRAAQQRAKTHCPQGHALTPDNVYLRGLNKDLRQCKTCTRERAHKRYWDGRGGGDLGWRRVSRTYWHFLIWTPGTRGKANVP